MDFFYLDGLKGTINLGCPPASEWFAKGDLATVDRFGF